MVEELLKSMRTREGKIKMLKSIIENELSYEEFKKQAKQLLKTFN
jgi:dephospho-CoA kinase